MRSGSYEEKKKKDWLVKKEYSKLTYYSKILYYKIEYWIAILCMFLGHHQPQCGEGIAFEDTLHEMRPENGHAYDLRFILCRLSNLTILSRLLVWLTDYT